MSLHPLSWTAWLTAAGVLAVVASNPWALLVALGAIGLVHLAGPPDDSPAGRAFRVFLAAGAVLLVVRLAFVALLGDPGGTVLATLPSLDLPRWLGGLSLGGPVSAEVLVASAVDGVRLLVVLAAFGIFNARVETAKLVRLVPGPLRDAGLVVSIAAAFVPGLLRSVRDVRDAQRLRGETGLRSVAPALVVPVLGMSLERAFLLAESMDARGYGRGASAPAPRAPLACGAAAVTLAAAVWVAGLRGMATGLVVLGGAGMAGALTVASRRTPVTRLAAPRWRPDDTLVALGAASCVVAALVVGGLAYSPYPLVGVPPFSVATAVPALLLAAPVRAEVRR